MFSLSFFSCWIYVYHSLCSSLTVFKSTEHNHVKDNLPAKLLFIRTFGKMKLEDFKDLISVSDYRMCKSKMDKHPTWYPLTLDVFVTFLYKVIVLQIAFFSSSHHFPTLTLYSYLHVAERNFKCGRYCSKALSRGNSRGSPVGP